MEFRILGPLQVTDGDRLIDLGSRKQRAVLAMLLIDANRVVSLDRLIDQLWGEEPPPRATASLQAYISNLRRAVEPNRGPRTRPEVLLTQPPGYALRLRPGDLDIARFEDAVASGNRLLTGGDPAGARQALVGGLELFRGEPLAEFAFEPFAAVEIARLEELRVGAVEGRIQADLLLGRHTEVVAELEGLVAAHPLREGLWGSLMKALYRCGRQAEALRAFEDARRTLVDQLGVRPGPELRRLEADILAQAPALDWNPPAGRPTPPVDGTSSPATMRATEDATKGQEPVAARRPMVGRDGPLGRLEAIRDLARDGQSCVALVSGEPGIGKSRLVQEFAARAETDGWAVAWGKCHGDGTPAFSPWAQVVRAMVSGPYRDIARNAFRPVADQLVQISTDLGELGHLPRAPVPEDADTARFRLYEAVLSFMTGMARDVPVVIVLEDLHWADPPSLQLLGFLAGALEGFRIVLVATYRPGEVEANEALAEALAVVAREDIAERVELAGLDVDAVGAFMTASLPTPPSAELVAAVHRRTDGNPFFVSELIRLLQSERRLENPASVMEAAVPQGVRDVIRRRLARLPEQTNSLLLIAAVAGREFELDVVQNASGLDIDRAIELMEAALINGIVEEDRNSPGRFRFSHALVQEAVYGQLTAVRRSRLHARVGLAIERLYGDQQGERLAELAHHFDQAVPAGEGERAFHYTLAAADDAQRRLAHGQAEAQLRRCLALVRRLTMVDRDRRELDVQLRLSLLLTMTVGYAAPEVADASERARQLCQRLGDREQMVPTMLRLWAFACVRADFIAADRIAAELLSAAGGDSRVLLGGHWATGVSAWHQGRLTEAAEHLGQAHLLGTSVDGESLSEVYTHHPSVVPAAFMAAVQWLIGERDAALATAETAVSTARQLGQPFSTVPALFFRSMVAAFEGDARTAAQVAAEAWDISSAGGFRLYMAMSRIMRGWAASQQGEAASGAGDIEQGLAEMEATGARMLRHFFLALLAEAYVAAGRTGDAVGAVDEALAAAEESGECFYLAELHRMRAVLLRCVTPPQPEEAAEELRRAAAIAEAQGALGLRRTVSEALVADTGDVPVPVVDSADPGCADGKPVGERTGTAEETLAAARRCLAEGDVLAAIALLDRGLLMLGDPELRLLRGQLAYYEAEWVVGRHHLEEAVRIFQQDGRPRRAALAASWVARVYLEGLDSPIAAKAWSARASRLLQGEGLCREAGWVAVNVLGCLVTDPDELDRRARLALDVARQLGDVDLEGKALADAGLAMVSTGQVRQGLEWLDEAMAMVTAGQVDMGIGAQMTCSFLTACERAGDLDRASAWLDILDRRSGPLATHCRLVCGALLCAVGRWDEGEAMLQETLQTGDLARPYHRVTARAALADLRIRQGDLVEAERLLRGLADHAEAAGPIARLHLARGEFLPAVAAARRGLRALGTDRLRAAPLYAAVAEAELSLGHLAAAEDAAAQAMELAEKVEVPSVGAVAALAAARVKAVTGPTEAATAVLHEALRRLSSHELPATRIALHLELARLYADTDKEAALAQARAALELGEGRTITLDRAASTLLCRLGVGNPTEVPASVRT